MIRTVKPFLSQESLKMVYYSCFHSIMTYGQIFWGNSCYSNMIFRLQKRITRIMVGISDRDSCREYFKELKILPLQSQYIYSLSLFVINNKHHFKVKSEIHNIVTSCRKPEYGNQNIRPSLDNGFDKHVPAATEKPVTIQQLAGLDVFRR
jgi:hypothetical protein